MTSLTKFLDHYDVASSIRFERTIHKGAFLLVEGKTDADRLSPFIDEKCCSIVICGGKKKLIGAIKLLARDRFLGTLGLVDGDFDRILGNLEDHKNLIYSEKHDFDLDWAPSTVVESYLRQVADKKKCDLHGGV